VAGALRTDKLTSEGSAHVLTRVMTCRERPIARPPRGHANQSWQALLDRTASNSRPVLLDQTTDLGEYSHVFAARLTHGPQSRDKAR